MHQLVKTQKSPHPLKGTRATRVATLIEQANSPAPLIK